MSQDYCRTPTSQDYCRTRRRRIGHGVAAAPASVCCVSSRGRREPPLRRVAPVSLLRSAGLNSIRPLSVRFGYVRLDTLGSARLGSARLPRRHSALLGQDRPYPVRLGYARRRTRKSPSPAPERPLPPTRALGFRDRGLEAGGGAGWPLCRHACWCSRSGAQVLLTRGAERGHQRWQSFPRS